MSWEVIDERTQPCPCGKGSISMPVYGDDWNRIEHGTVKIQCEQCSAKYRVETEYIPEYHPGHGDSLIYYLTPIDYPYYQGIKADNVYRERQTLNDDFIGYIIENFSYDDLNEALYEYEEKRYSSKVTGVAKQICGIHKNVYNTTKTEIVLNKIIEAEKLYWDYEGNFEQRRIAKAQETHERKIYNEEKRKHQIRLAF